MRPSITAPPALRSGGVPALATLPGTRDLPSHFVDITITYGNRSQSERTDRLFRLLNPLDPDTPVTDRLARNAALRPHSWRPFAGAHEIVRQSDAGHLNNLNLPLETVGPDKRELVFLMELEHGRLGARKLLDEVYWDDFEADYHAQKPVAEQAGLAIVEYVSRVLNDKVRVKVIMNHTSGFCSDGEATVRPYGIVSSS